MKVYILSKHQFDTLMFQKGIFDNTVDGFAKTFFISINDANGTTETPHFSEDHPNVLRQFFDDVDEALEVPILGTTEVKRCTPMSENQARELFAFIQQNADRETCIVHCGAGVSRSGGVGSFVNEYFKGDYFQFKRDNPNIQPNIRILCLLRAVAEEQSECKSIL